jgi:hypothetical protein
MRLVLAAALLSLASPASARTMWKNADIVDIRATTEPVSFYPERPRHTLDRGKLLYIGRGAVRDPEAVHVYDFATRQKSILRPPTSALARARKELSPVVEDLLCYDSVDGVATLLLEPLNQGDVMLYVARWDLATNQIKGVWPLVERKPTSRWAGAHVVDYVIKRRECVVQIEHNTGLSEVSIVAIGDEPRVVAAYTAERKLTHGPYIDAAQTRVLSTEYAELPEESAPQGHLVDLTTGAVQHFDIPKVCYGAAFHPNGKRLYAYGLNAGSIAVIDLATGKTVKHVKVVTHGHALGWVAPNLLALATNGSLQLLDGKTLRPKLVVPTKSINYKFSNVDGSMVLPRRVVFDNFEELFVIDVTP